MTRTQRHIEEIRTGDASIEVHDAVGRRAGVPVSVEQERHAFPFGCVVPDLDAYSDTDRVRYRARLDEVFNWIGPVVPSDRNILRFDVAERVHLGLLRIRLDQLAASGLSLHIYVRGEAVGMTGPADDERDLGRRVAELYMLCFAQPAVGGVFWQGFADGDRNVGGGLLHRDLAPKYACKVLRKLIGDVWHSRAGGVTDANGLFRFRGFYGDYRVVTDLGEPAARAETIALRRGGASRFQVGRTSSLYSSLDRLPDNR